MYPHFIEVKDYRDERIVSINVDTITNFFANEEGGTDIELTTCQFCHAKESYTEVKALLHDCGCHIQKADPRLDTSHPLTMDDLQEMVGEPVWNSNLNVWMLIRKVDDLYADMVSVSGDVHYWTESDLKQFPLYRMQTQPLRERLVDVLREVRGEK